MSANRCTTLRSSVIDVKTGNKQWRSFKVNKAQDFHFSVSLKKIIFFKSTYQISLEHLQIGKKKYVNNLTWFYVGRT